MNTEILTRFELFVEGESQNIGFLRGLESTGLSEDLQDILEYPFKKELIIPDKKYYESDKKDKFINSYFTNAGLIKFKEAIDEIINEIYYDGLFTVGKIEVVSGINEEKYRDEYQVLMETNDLTDITYSVLDLKPGIYKILKDKKQVDLFNKYCLEETLDSINKETALRIYPDCLNLDNYYYLDLENNLVEILKSTD